MPKTALNRTISSGSTYTVPAGKFAIFSAFLARKGPAGWDGTLTIAGQSIALFDATWGEAAMSGAGPFTAGPGDVIALQTTSNAGLGLSGFLYDG